jgi:hypothetical protein
VELGNLRCQAFDNPVRAIGASRHQVEDVLRRPINQRLRVSKARARAKRVQTLCLVLHNPLHPRKKPISGVSNHDLLCFHIGDDPFGGVGGGGCAEIRYLVQ